MTTKIFTLATAVILTFWLTACGPTNQPVPNKPDVPANSGEVDPVTIQFSWTHDTEYTGFYMAQDKGYYTAENLNVSFNVGGMSAEGKPISPVEEVVSKRATFGTTDASVLLHARSEGAPVVAIATTYQRHPLALTSLAEKGIVKPQDLVGKKVQLGGTNKVIFQALLATQGIDPAQVNQEDRTDYTIAPLVNGEADVIDAWVTNEVDILLLGGHEINFILASDYGIDLYPNVIFTTEETIAQNPDLVERFLRATIKGLEDSVASPEEATKLLLTYDKRPEDAALAAMQRSIPLINPPDSSLGMMSPEVWETTYKILEEQKVLPKPVDVKTAYTLDFLNKVHSQK